MIRYVAVQEDTPNTARAWGEGETHDESRLQCEIAIREKYLGKLSRGYRGRTDVRIHLLPAYHFGLYLSPVHYLDAVSTLIRSAAKFYIDP